jgi:signal transduction histidine kinase
VTATTWPGLTDDELDGLGLAELEMLRDERYRGTGQACELGQLDAGDRDTVRLLYDQLRGIYDAWRADPASPDWDDIARRTLALAESELVGRVGALGLEGGEPPGLDPGRDGTGLQDPGQDASDDGPGAPESSGNDPLDGVLHDLRGGAATAVLAEAELLEPGLRSALDAGTVDAEALESIVLLARDQAKIMRNALLDLDPEERARDTLENPHRLDDLIDRWDDVRYRTLDGTIRVRAARDAPGILSSCCLEFGAVDRVAYNLINNAARHSADGEVALQARHASESLFRIAVTNRVDRDHGHWLAEGLKEDPTFLFRWGATRSRAGVELASGDGLRLGSRSGSGLGLGIVAEFVAAAFGVPTIREALEGGYLGSTQLDDRLAVWFHWPAFPVEAPERVTP